jgi:hypothetical protein
MNPHKDFRDLYTLIENGDYWQCDSCQECFLEYNRFCACGREKGMILKDCGTFVNEFKEVLLQCLKRAE